MLFERIKLLAQAVGFVTLAFLAVNGGLALLSGNLAWDAGFSRVLEWTTPSIAEAAPAEKALADTLEWETATVPPVVSYQGFLRDAEGNPLSGHYPMTFRLYDRVEAPVGQEIWSEEHMTVTVRSGRFSVLLGDDIPFPETVFASPDRFIGVTIGDHDEMVPKQRFASSPYAVHADRAAGLSAVDGTPRDAVTLDNEGNVMASEHIVAGGVSAPDAEPITTMGARSGLSLRDRDGESPRRVIYPSGDKLRFWRDGSDDQMVIDSTGNVGIGTENPDQRLEVFDTSFSVARIRTAGEGTDAVLQLMAGSDYWNIQNDDSNNNDLGFRFNNETRVRITRAGNVGIGSDIPEAKLEVDGDIAVVGNFEQGKGITMNGRPLIKILRMTNLGDNANEPTGVLAENYHCVATGWQAFYDIKEEGAHANMVWTYIYHEGPGAPYYWYVRTDFAHGGDSPRKIENPNVDILCISTAIAAWKVGERTSKNPPEE